MFRLDEDKELAIYTWLSTIWNGETISIALGGNTDCVSIASTNIVWDKPDNLRPSLPYATMNISSGPRSVGNPAEAYYAVDTYAYNFKEVCTLTVNVYADNYYLLLIELLKNSIMLPSIQSILQSAGLAVWGHSDPMDISLLLDTKHEKRAAIDFFMAYGKVYYDRPGEIRKVRIVGTINETVDVDKTIDIEEV